MPQPLDHTVKLTVGRVSRMRRDLLVVATLAACGSRDTAVVDVSSSRKRGPQAVASLWIGIACLVGGVAMAEEPATLVPGVQEIDPKSVGDDFDWANGSPFDFLEHLRKKHVKARHIYVIASQHEHWVRPEHLPGLIDLLDSTEVCVSTNSAYSSVHALGFSTVGNEAAHLIHGFRRGRFPPFAVPSLRWIDDALRPAYGEAEKREIRAWWTRYNSDTE